MNIEYHWSVLCCEGMLGVLNRTVKKGAAGPDSDMGLICELLRVICPASLLFIFLFFSPLLFFVFKCN